MTIELVAAAVTASLGKTSRDTLETVSSLRKHPFDHTHIVIAETEVVVKSRKALSLTSLLHLVELADFKLMVLNHAPVVRRGVHWEAWRQRAIRTDNNRILASPAIPRFNFPAQKLLHIVQTLDPS